MVHYLFPDLLYWALMVHSDSEEIQQTARVCSPQAKLDRNNILPLPHYRGCLIVNRVYYPSWD